MRTFIVLSRLARMGKPVGKEFYRYMFNVRFERLMKLRLANPYKALYPFQWLGKVL